MRRFLNMKHLYIQHYPFSKNISWVEIEQLENLNNYFINDNHLNIYIHFETKYNPSCIYVWGMVHGNKFYERFLGLSRCLEYIDDIYVDKSNYTSCSSRSSRSSTSSTSSSSSCSSRSSSSETCREVKDEHSKELRYLSGSIKHDLRHSFRNAIKYYSERFDKDMKQKIVKIYGNYYLKNISNVYWYGFSNFLAFLVLNKYQICVPSIPLPCHWVDICCTQGFGYFSKVNASNMNLSNQFRYVHIEAQNFMNLWSPIFKPGPYLNTEEAVLSCNVNCLKRLMLLKEQLEEGVILDKIEKLATQPQLLTFNEKVTQLTKDVFNLEQKLNQVIEDRNLQMIAVDKKLDQVTEELKIKIEEDLFRLGVMMLNK